MSRTSFVRRPLAVLASGVVFLGVIVTTPGVAAAAGPPCDGVFHRVPVPKFPGLSELLAVDGVGADDVRVTGLDFSRRTSIVPILHWTGSGWVDETFQAPEFLSYLQGISMDSPNDGVAVGTTLPTGLVERWNGTDWGREARTSELQEVPLFAVEAVNDVDAWAVGAEYGPAGSGVAAGEAQRFVPRPGKTLRATGGADAAGRFEIPNRSEIWHYDGFRWHQADHPAKLVRNTALYGVGASGPDDVWAVGVSHMEFTTRDFYRALGRLVVDGRSGAPPRLHAECSLLGRGGLAGGRLGRGLVRERGRPPHPVGAPLRRDGLDAAGRPAPGRERPPVVGLGERPG
jgi:hypothetical protein